MHIFDDKMTLQILSVKNIMDVLDLKDNML